jgi:hypothetical protein
MELKLLLIVLPSFWGHRACWERNSQKANLKKQMEGLWRC